MYATHKHTSSHGAVASHLLVRGLPVGLCDPWLPPCLADGGFIPAIPSPIVKLQKQWSTQVGGRGAQVPGPLAEGRRHGLC